MEAGSTSTDLLIGLNLRNWRVEMRAEGVLVVVFDRAENSVNAFSQETLIELDAILERIENDPPKGVIFKSGKDKGFIAGADIKEFQDFDRKGTIADAIARGQNVFQRLNSLRVPTVAAIHGFCMGGGTELALACTYRVASNDSSTRIGLPEVKLGIYPGWGGSVRLPRLIGAPAAMDLMLTGRTVSASAAKAMGLVDKVTDAATLEDKAAEIALKGYERPFKQRALAWATNTVAARKALKGTLISQVARKAKKDHYPAPYQLINTWSNTGGGIRNLLKAEQRSVVKLSGTPTARNLIRVYFLQENLKAQGSGPSNIEHVHVVGAGVMGGDIAAWAAYKGFNVTLNDRDAPALEKAQTRAQELFAKKVKDDAKRPAVAARYLA